MRTRAGAGGGGVLPRDSATSVEWYGGGVVEGKVTFDRCDVSALDCHGNLTYV